MQELSSQRHSAGHRIFFRSLKLACFSRTHRRQNGSRNLGSIAGRRRAARTVARRLSNHPSEAAGTTAIHVSSVMSLRLRILPAAFADLIASALNANVTSWRSGPAATEIERQVIAWLASLIGYGDGDHPAFGLLTSGGSMANLTALMMAHRHALVRTCRQRVYGMPRR